MKKLLIISILFFLCSCSNKSLETNEVSNSTVEEIVQEYVDENPVTISLYVDNAIGGLDIAGKEFHSIWQSKRDIVILSSIFSNEEQIAANYFQYMWLNAAEKYENYKNYKTGWYINFNLEDGTNYEKNIFHPDDVTDLYEFVEIYLYDSVNQELGAWYSHLTAKDMNNETIMTTMKLTAGSKYEEIEGPIVVKVFTYDDMNDFDDNGFYRGNSLSTIKVYND